MDTIDNVSHARELMGKLSPQELEFLGDLTAGCSQASIAARLKLRQEDAAALKQSLMKKLGAAVTADAVRIGIYAGV